MGVSFIHTWVGLMGHLFNKGNVGLFWPSREFVQTQHGHAALCLVIALQPGPEGLLRAVLVTQLLQRDYCRKTCTALINSNKIILNLKLLMKVSFSSLPHGQSIGFSW